MCGRSIERNREKEIKSRRFSFFFSIETASVFFFSYARITTYRIGGPRP